MKVYGYGRVSTNKQEISEAVQKAACIDWFSMRKGVGSLPEDAEWAGWFYDEDVSARTTPFLDRVNGEAILLRVDPGDIIVSSKFDRMFRKTLDFCVTVEKLEEAGIKLVLLDADFDTSTPMGQACMKIIAVIKELEALEIGRRTKDAFARMRQLGGYTGGTVPMGWKPKKNTHRSKGEPKKLLVPDHHERRICLEALELRRKGLSLRKTAEALYKLGVRKTDKRDNGGYLPTYSPEAIKSMCRAARAGFPIKSISACEEERASQ